jgi:hypothetical protein
MLIPPWLIDELEEERRRDDGQRPSLELPLEEARDRAPPTSQRSENRGVMIVDISPADGDVIRL